jgi:hypothetical protein
MSENPETIGLLSEEQRPASSSLLVALAESVRGRREHEHPEREDFFCLNQVGWAGERMGAVLAVLLAALADADHLSVRAAELETAQLGGYQAAIEVMRQERLPMSAGLLEAARDLEVMEAGEEPQGGPAPLALRWSAKDLALVDDGSAELMLTTAAGTPALLVLEPEKVAALAQDLGADEALRERAAELEAQLAECRELLRVRDGLAGPGKAMATEDEGADQGGAA